MNTELRKKTASYFLSFLILISNFSPTFAMANAIVYGEYVDFFINPSSVGKKGGAVPIDQVDLGTGNVTLQESIFAVEGYHFSLTYNSEGVAQKASIWNRDQKQGVLGLGWEYPEDKIIRLTQQTGTLKDDEYLLYTKGNSFPLIFISKKNGEKEYRIAKQPNWIVKHHLSLDQWKVSHPDGQVYIYGDGSLTKHVSNGVEYNIKWGNWIGSSSVIEEQSRLPISYNLSAIETIFGEQVQFFYQKQEEQVGDRGLQHTRATYLSKVKGLRGKTIEFTYSDKNTNEYTDPHTENLASGVNDKDSYQERYENKYLSGVQLKNRKGNPMRGVRFDYSFLKENTELQKRLLTKINYLDSKGDFYKPAKLFDYFGLKLNGDTPVDGVKAGFTKTTTTLYNSTNGALYGAIKQQTLPEGVSYAYHYSKQKIEGGSRDIEIIFPENPHNDTYGVDSRWSAPELFYGSNYVVAIFESQDLTRPQSYIKVYQWIGDRWLEKDLGQFDGYFYDRYFAKDQYNKGVLKKIKEKVFEAITEVAPAAMGVINSFEDALKDEAKTFYKVGDDISQGNIGKAIKDWYTGQFTAIKDIALDVAAGFEKEAEALKELIDSSFGSSETQFTNHQKKLYAARDKDAAVNPRKAYHITLQNNFFALTSSRGGSQVVIVHKNNLVSGEWTINREGANLTSKFFSLGSGDNFMALLDEVTDFLYIYSWDVDIWSTYSKQLRTNFNTRITSNSGKNAIESAFDSLLGTTGEEAQERLNHRSAISVKNNLIVGVITDSHGINADISLLYHDQNMNWNQKSTQLNKKATIFGDTATLSAPQASIASTFLGKDGKIDVKTGNSFAVLQTYDNLDENLPDVTDIPILGSLIGTFVPNLKKTNSTYSIVWDENYDNIRLSHLHSAAGQDGVESFIVGDVIHKIGKAHSLLVGSNDALSPSDGKNYAFRYTGKEFLTKELSSPYYAAGFANDIAPTVIESSNKAYKTPQFHQYNPNTQQWDLIENASSEQIATTEYINEAINVSVEVLNIVVLVATIIIPGIGEAVAAEETLEVINSAVNMVGLASMIMEPVSKELVKDIMGTNHKSTAIANNYLSVNGKLFHRRSSGNWEEVTHNEFELGDSSKLVGSTNSIVEDFLPYTIKTAAGIENHCFRLRNGKVYTSNKFPSDANKIVHQDSISNTIGLGAYVSYGPVGSNGFVAKNDYLDNFQPTIGESAEVRSRNDHPAYKEATAVTLHKVTGDSFEKELYDYPVTKVSIQQGNETLSYHYYKYDSISVSYHSASQIAFYGKVTDIPSSTNYAVNADIPLDETDGGYIEHYYYNRYNSYGSVEKAKGHPSSFENLEYTDIDLVSYNSSYTDDNESFKKGTITPLEGHPYASLVYNTDQEVVSQDYTYYKVWERDLKHQLDGTELQETRIYPVRAAQQIKVIDGVAHKTKYVYEFTALNNHLHLREESVEGHSSNGTKETHKTRHTYAFEHYSDLKEQNRLREHFMTVSSVKKGTEDDIITSVDVTTYEDFTINEKEVLVPKHFYKAKEGNSDPTYYNNSESVLGDITADILAQEAAEMVYESKVMESHKGYIDTYKAADFLLKKEGNLNSEIHQLNSDIHKLSQDIDGYKKLILTGNDDIEAIHTTIESLHQEVTSFNTAIVGKQNQINAERENIASYNSYIDLGWLGGLIGYGIAYGINHHKINEAKDRIEHLYSGIKTLKQDIQQKRNEISTKRIEVRNLIDEENDLKKWTKAFEVALDKEIQAYHSLKDRVGNSLLKSYKALKGYPKTILDTSKHHTAITELQEIQDNNLHDNYVTALEELHSKATSNLPAISYTSSNGSTVILTSYGDAFQDNIKRKINTLKEKIGTYKTNLLNLSNKHQGIIDYITELLSKGEEPYTSYGHKWIKTQYAYPFVSPLIFPYFKL